MLLDGRSVYLDFYGLVLWDLLPVNLDEVRRVEIMRGPGSAVWGDNGSLRLQKYRAASIFPVLRKKMLIAISATALLPRPRELAGLQWRPRPRLSLSSVERREMH